MREVSEQRVDWMNATHQELKETDRVWREYLRECYSQWGGLEHAKSWLGRWLKPEGVREDGYNPWFLILEAMILNPKGVEAVFCEVCKDSGPCHPGNIELVGKILGLWHGTLDDFPLYLSWTSQGYRVTQHEKEYPSPDEWMGESHWVRLMSWLGVQGLTPEETWKRHEELGLGKELDIKSQWAQWYYEHLFKEQANVYPEATTQSRGLKKTASFNRRQ